MSGKPAHPTDKPATVHPFIASAQIAAAASSPTASGQMRAMGAAVGMGMLAVSMLFIGAVYIGVGDAELAERARLAKAAVPVIPTLATTQPADIPLCLPGPGIQPVPAINGMAATPPPANPAMPPSVVATSPTVAAIPGVGAPNMPGPGLSAPVQSAEPPVVAKIPSTPVKPTPSARPVTPKPEVVAIKPRAVTPKIETARPPVRIASIAPSEPSYPKPLPSARESDEWDIREAVFRYMFQNNASSGEAFSYYFIFLGAKGDAPPSFVSRFRGNVPEVLPASDAASQDNMRVVHKYRSGRGLLFKTNKITWLDQSTVDVDGGFYESQMSLSGDTFRVARRDNRWVVVKDTRRYTSLGRY